MGGLGGMVFDGILWFSCSMGDLRRRAFTVYTATGCLSAMWLFRSCGFVDLGVGVVGL